MKTPRSRFYPILAVCFLFFFMLHWNGLLDFTYYWFLVRIDGTHSFLPQVTAAFVSSTVIFGIIAFFYEYLRKRDGDGS